MLNIDLKKRADTKLTIAVLLGGLVIAGCSYLLYDITMASIGIVAPPLRNTELSRPVEQASTTDTAESVESGEAPR